MPPIEVRPFQRCDREQLAALVNAHVGAVLPGVSVSVNAVMSQLEREPEEEIVDPWAVERATLVAIESDRVAAAAHLVRYGTGERVSASYRDSAEIRWIVFRPGDAAAADVLAARCVAVMEGWGVARMYADGSLPAPAVYGVPDVWPHVADALVRAGFAPGGREEAVLVADVAGLPCGGAAPVAGMTVARALGGHATRFSALLDGPVVGIYEVQADLTAGGTLSRLAGWADVWELHVDEALRRRGIGTWLVGHGADWLRLARAERLLDCVVLGDGDAHLTFLRALGFRELTRTRRAARGAARSGIESETDGPAPSHHTRQGVVTAAPASGGEPTASGGTHRRGRGGPPPATPDAGASSRRRRHDYVPVSHSGTLIASVETMMSYRQEC